MKPADALVVFASPTHDHTTLLEELRTRTSARVIVGASSAGEFTSAARSENSACVLALRSDEIEFTAAIGRGLAKDPSGAARAIAASFRGINDAGAFPYRTALIFTDALAGHADRLIDELTLATSGKYQFVGGGAGDNAQFRRTPVFHDREVVADAVVALEILSKKPIGIGVGHGWEPASAAMRVTEAVGNRIVSLNSLPARDMFVRHADATRQALDVAAPIPFFLHNILGIDTGSGHRLRVPLQIFDDGSVACAAEVPTGAVVHIMRSNAASAADAAARAAAAAVEPVGALRRLRRGKATGGVAIEQRGSAADLARSATTGEVAQSWRPNRTPRRESRAIRTRARSNRDDESRLDPQRSQTDGCSNRDGPHVLFFECRADLMRDSDRF